MNLTQKRRVKKRWMMSLTQSLEQFTKNKEEMMRDLTARQKAHHGEEVWKIH